MPYIILEDSSSTGLERQVDKHISAGWKIQGGVGSRVFSRQKLKERVNTWAGRVDYFKTIKGIVYTQAMVKKA